MAIDQARLESQLRNLEDQLREQESKRLSLVYLPDRSQEQDYELSLVRRTIGVLEQQVADVKNQIAAASMMTTAYPPMREQINSTNRAILLLEQEYSDDRRERTRRQDQLDRRLSRIETIQLVMCVVLTFAVAVLSALSYQALLR